MRRQRTAMVFAGGLLALTTVLSGCGPNASNNTETALSNRSAVGSLSNDTTNSPANDASKTNSTAGQTANQANSATSGENTNSSSNTPATSSTESGSQNNTDGSSAGNGAANGTSSSGSNGTSGTPGTSNTTGSGQQDLVPYNGPFQHVFFHPLMAFPSLSFSPKDPERKGFNDWFVTVNEFDKILNALYQQNYILIDINSLYTETTKNGKTYIHKKQLMLPKGKKPLVLSVDDMNYYDYMQKWGTVQRLVLDSQGDVAALSRFPDGHTAITYNNAIVPVLDAFVKLHPDFSFEGAKGTINLTGYQGVLGYRTNDTSAPNYATTKAEAMKVIARLKATGWTFASHGWGHLPDATISYQTFVADTNRWLKEVEPLTGPTQVYVYPFGSRVATNGPKYNYLIQKGFHVLCSVGPTTYVKWTPQTLMMDRMHIDGISLHSERKSLDILLGNAKILDPVRPSTY